MGPRPNEVQPTARRVLYLLHSGVFLYESSDGNFNYNDFFHDGGEKGVVKKADSAVAGSAFGLVAGAGLEPATFGL